MKSFLALLFLFFAILPADAVPVRVEWDARPAEEKIDLYALYLQQPDDSWAMLTTSQETEITIELPPGTHILAVRAVNVWGEGPLSESYTTPNGVPGAVQNLRIVIASP